MRHLNLKLLNILRMFIELNFYASLTLVIIGCGISFSDNYTLFDFNTELYGELANNLRIIMVYVSFTSIVIFGFCYFTRQYHYYLLVGIFLLLMEPALIFYGQVNNVEIDPDLEPFFIYIGLSHLLFGFLPNLFKSA